MGVEVRWITSEGGWGGGGGTSRDLQVAASSRLLYCKQKIADSSFATYLATSGTLKVRFLGWKLIWVATVFGWMGKPVSGV